MKELDKFVSDALNVIMRNRERYVTAWVAETGVLPSEAVLIEQHMADGSIRLTIEKRK